MGEQRLETGLRDAPQKARLLDAILRGLTTAWSSPPPKASLSRPARPLVACWADPLSDLHGTPLLPWLRQLDEEAYRRWPEIEARARESGACPGVVLPGPGGERPGRLLVSAIWADLPGPAGGAIVSSWRDVTAIRDRIVEPGPALDQPAKPGRDEAEHRRLTRALLVLSRCNQALIRATEEPALMREMCRIIVEVGVYRLAWVGLAEEDEEKTVRPAAQWGYEDGYLDTVGITWADTERGRGPTGRAIRTGRPWVMRDIPNDPAFKPWREQALERGYARPSPCP